MIAVVQRCLRGEVRVGGEPTGALPPGGGLVVLVGIEVGDTLREAERLGDKIARLRIFEDEAGRMNRSVIDAGGGVLVVSQFTLAGDAREGNRPSFTNAARPEEAEPLVESVVDRIRTHGLPVGTGRFRTEMAVELVNDGPVTIILKIDPRTA